MSRNYTIAVTSAVFILGLSGCSHKEPIPTTPVIVKPVVLDTNLSLTEPTQVQQTPCLPPERIMETTHDHSQLEEDTYTLEALDAISRGNFPKAKKSFVKAYSVKKNRDLLVEAAKIGFSLRQTDDVVPALEEYWNENNDDLEIGRMVATAYILKKDFSKAKSTIATMMGRKPTITEAIFAGDSMLFMNDYEKAVKYYKLGYSLKPSDTLMEKIGTILAEKLGRNDEAIAYYETHIRIYGCSKALCLKLSELYAQAGDVENVLTIAKKMYQKYKDPQIANKVVQLYLIQNNLDGLIDFLKKSKFDDSVLFEAYKAKKDYPNAAKIALAIYQKTKDTDYLGQAAILRFESANKEDMAMVHETVKALKIVVAKSDNDLYFNYLGYLLIDYNLGVSEGVDLVKKALEKSPDNIAYVDSLAWGYAKMKRCKEAYELIIKVRNAMPEDKTVREHFDEIKRCYQKGVEGNKTLRDIIR